MSESPRISSTDPAKWPPPLLEKSCSAETVCTDVENSQTPEQSPAPLVATPNISIGKMFVYNFTQSANNEAPFQEKANSRNLASVTSYVRSVSSSSGPFCRICHEGDAMEELVSPCYCTGSLALVHQSCIERWLSITNSDKCEICNYTFPISRTPRSFSEWVYTSVNRRHQRSLIGDFFCFILLTPLAFVSTFLCIDGAQRESELGNNLEAGCLVALTSFLITIYLSWTVLMVRYHYFNWKSWRSRNQSIKLLSRFRRLLPSTETGTIAGQVCPSHSRNPSIPSVHINIGCEGQPRVEGQHTSPLPFYGQNSRIDITPVLNRLQEPYI